MSSWRQVQVVDIGEDQGGLREGQTTVGAVVDLQRAGYTEPFTPDSPRRIIDDPVGETGGCCQHWTIRESGIVEVAELVDADRLTCRQGNLAPLDEPGCSIIRIDFNDDPGFDRVVVNPSNEVRVAFTGAAEVQPITHGRDTSVLAEFDPIQPQHRILDSPTRRQEHSARSGTRQQLAHVSDLLESCSHPGNNASKLASGSNSNVHDGERFGRRNVTRCFIEPGRGSPGVGIRAAVGDAQDRVGTELHRRKRRSRRGLHCRRWFRRCGRFRSVHGCALSCWFYARRLHRLWCVAV